MNRYHLVSLEYSRPQKELAPTVAEWLMERSKGASAGSAFRKKTSSCGSKKKAAPKRSSTKQTTTASSKQ